MVHGDYRCDDGASVILQGGGVAPSGGYAKTAVLSPIHHFLRTQYKHRSSYIYTSTHPIDRIGEYLFMQELLLGTI
jgi:hypothetical protein